MLVYMHGIAGSRHTTVYIITLNFYCKGKIREFFNKKRFYGSSRSIHVNNPFRSAAIAVAPASSNSSLEP